MGKKKGWRWKSAERQERKTDRRNICYWQVCFCGLVKDAVMAGGVMETLASMERSVLINKLLNMRMFWASIRYLVELIPSNY